MYSRFGERSPKPLRIPEHYSGCAFSSSSYPPISNTTPPKKEEPLPSPLPKRDEAYEGTVSSDQLEARESASEHGQKPPKKEGTPLPAVLGSRSVSLPLGMSFDELLLIGLILLLSHSETDSDIVLWLALLLFCK